MLPDLLQLAQDLRSKRVLPQDVPLRELTRAVLTEFYNLRAAHPELASIGLPQVAMVIALKTKLLIPDIAANHSEADPEFLDDEPLDLVDQVLASLGTLQELRSLVDFLQHKRHHRQQVLTAKPISTLTLPRPISKTHSLQQLLHAAQHTIREVSVEQLSRDRLNLSQAKDLLLAFGRKCRRFLFSSLQMTSWAEHGVYFSALLEAIKTGQVQAQQAEIYGEIEISWVNTESANS